MPLPFSVLSRAQALQLLKTEEHDLLIIGGGITGAGIALDAASRGLKTALIEKNDFAYGTSSRSTKLIHGGLRYLKQFEFGLVKEVGGERAVIHKLAPHLVVPEKMLLPLYEKKGLGYWLTSIGLKIYDFLAGVNQQDRRRMLTRAQTLKHEPMLDEDGVKGGAIYAEYRTDDARLTIETIKTAVKQNALAINYLKVTNFIYDATNRIVGAEVTDQLTNEIFSISTRVVVSATGPWVDELRELDQSKNGKHLQLTKGVHIVVPWPKFPIKQAIYFDVPDGRMVFAIPRGRITYIGTTDTQYTSGKEQVVTTREDADYLLAGVHSAFKNIRLTTDDIESSWAGLRPLIHEDGKSPGELSRKDEIFESVSGLVSIAGGKLTGYRKMAERVVELVIRKHFRSLSLRQCSTDKISIVEPAFISYEQVKNHLDILRQRLKPCSLSGFVAPYLLENYGRQADTIIQYFFDHRGGHDERSLLEAEAWFALHHECATNLADFFVRRTGLLYFDIGKVIRYQESIADFFARTLNWDNAKKSEALRELQKCIADATAYNTK